MTDRWTDLRELFHELVELDEAGRARRLGEVAARDPTLVARLEALLLADAAAESGAFGRVEAFARSLLADPGPPAAGDPLGMLGATIGRYVVEALVAAGGMGVVYRAADRRLGRLVALKFLPPPWSLDATARERFLREARAAAALDHPNVCTVHEADETAEGVPYIVMALYEGETLQARLERGPLPVGKALDVALQAARGLAAAHARGLVHRDVKPANLLITTDGTLKILDFGVARAADWKLTAPEQRPGTAAYMAPEQSRGEEVDGRADLWSLGVVLYEMLTGVRPGSGAASVTAAPVAPSALRPEAPAWVDDLVVRLLAHDRSCRPAGAGVVVSVIEEGRTSVGPDGPGVGRAAGAGGRASRRGGGNRRRALLAAAAFGTVLAGVYLVSAAAGVDPVHSLLDRRSLGEGERIVLAEPLLSDVSAAPQDRMRAHVFLAGLALWRGRISEAREHLGAAARNAVDVSPSQPFLQRLFTAHAEVMVGDPERGVRLLADGLDRGMADGLPPEDQWHFIQAWILGTAGHVDDAEGVLDRFHSEVPREFHDEFHARNETARAVIALRRGRPMEAVRVLEQARSAYSPCRFCAADRMGWALREAGLLREAAAEWEGSLGWRDHMFPSEWGTLSHLWVLQRLPALYEEVGDTTQALGHYQRLVALWEEADPELQPRVDRARERIAALTARRRHQGVSGETSLPR